VIKGPMTTIQPLLALALAVLCGLLSEIPNGQKRFCIPNIWSLVAYTIMLCGASFCTIKLGHVDDHRAVIASIAAGGIVSVLAVVGSNLSIGTSIALAVSGACVAHLVRADSFPEVGLAYAFSVAMGAIFFGSYPGPISAALVGGVVTMTDYLGKDSEGTSNRAIVGVAMGLALTVAAVLILGVRKAVPRALGRLEPGLVAVLAAGAGYAVSRWAVGGDLWIVAGLPAIAGLIVHWLIPKDQDPIPLRIGIATVIWLALGTIGFSMLRGFGIAAALVEGIFVLLMLGNCRALLTVGPTLGLLMYRVLRDASPDTSRALDIGQHYGITGLVVGGIIPLLFVDWFEKQRSNKPIFVAISGLLWGFIVISLPVLTIVVLGAKGASGVVVGLGFSGFLLAGRKTSNALVLSVAIAAGAANAVAVDWVGDAMDFTRQDKLHSFGWWCFAMAVATIGILVVSKPGKTQEAS